MKQILFTLLMAMPLVCVAQETTVKDTVYDNAKAFRVIERADSVVLSEAAYSVLFDKQKKENYNRLERETLYYPDGQTKETLVLDYRQAKNGVMKLYERKCYYPNGTLQYEEIKDDPSSEIKTTYYNEKGKKTRHPQETIPLYMQMPEFPGGQEALIAYLTKTVKYPDIARANGIQGRVLVQFVVAKDGQIENVEVLRSGGDPSLDKEAVRVIQSMPRWIPGTQRGNPVRVQYKVPVNFRL